VRGQFVSEMVGPTLMEVSGRPMAAQAEEKTDGPSVERLDRIMSQLDRLCQMVVKEQNGDEVDILSLRAKLKDEASRRHKLDCEVTELLAQLGGEAGEEVQETRVRGERDGAKLEDVFEMYSARKNGSRRRSSSEAELNANKISELEERLSAVEQSAGFEQLAHSLRAVQEILQELQARIGTVEGVEEELQRLQERVDSIERCPSVTAESLRDMQLQIDAHVVRIEKVLPDVWRDAEPSREARDVRTGAVTSEVIEEKLEAMLAKLGVVCPKGGAAFSQSGNHLTKHELKDATEDVCQSDVDSPSLCAVPQTRSTPGSAAQTPVTPLVSWNFPPGTESAGGSEFSRRETVYLPASCRAPHSSGSLEVGSPAVKAPCRMASQPISVPLTHPPSEVSRMASAPGLTPVPRIMRASSPATRSSLSTCPGSGFGSTKCHSPERTASPLAPPLSPPLPVRPTSRTSPNAASRNVRSTPRSLAETPRHPARGAHGEAHEGDRNAQGFPVRWGPSGSPPWSSRATVPVLNSMRGRAHSQEFPVRPY